MYENGVYNEKSDLTAAAKVREHLIAEHATMGGISDVEGQWRMLIERPPSDINAYPYIINLRNGLYDLSTESFSSHDPTLLSTVQLNTSYNPDAQCPVMMSFLRSALGDEEIPLIQEILGYFLIPVNKAQKAFIFAGAPNSGKSTLLSVVQTILLGPQNVSNIPLQQLSDRFKTSELFGKLANIFADLDNTPITDTGIFKAVTGEDYITVEKKNKAPFSFKPYARLLFSCNSLPRNIGDRSGGFYRRLIIIRFKHTVPESERDVYLHEKLYDERDGILMWAIEGLKRLIAHNYKFTDTASVREELQRYELINNSILSFVADECTLADGASCLRNGLYNAYKTYCENGGLKPVPQRTFVSEMENEYPQLTRSADKKSRCATWDGISHNAE